MMAGDKTEIERGSQHDDFRRNAVSSALETFDVRARETAETLKGYEDKQRAEVNPMCKTCKAFGSTCNGTPCMTYTGCIYKR